MNKQEVFVSRKITERTAASKRNTLLIGPPKSGKTMVLTQLDGIYIDFAKLSMSPERFAVEFIGEIAFASVKREDKTRWLDIAFLFENRSLFGKAATIIEQVHNELQKIKPDQRQLLEWAFSFPNLLGKKVVLLVDNFDEITGMNNYDQIKNVLLLFFSYSLPNVRFVMTGLPLLEKGFSASSFMVEKVGLLDREETQQVTESVLGKVSNDVVQEIFALSQGYPFFAAAIAQRYKETKDVKKAFLWEVMSKEGLVFNACKFEMYTALGNARGQTLLKTILKVLSKEKTIRLSELSRKIYRSAPVTQSLLLRLLELHLVSKKDTRFFFTNPVLHFWARNYFWGSTFSGRPPESSLRQEVKL